MSILDMLNPASWAASAIGAIGGRVAEAVIGWHKDTLDAANTEARIKADLAQRELAVQQVETQAQAQLKIAEVGHPWEPEKLFAYIMVIYLGKAIIFDKVIGSLCGDTGNIFSTDPIKGDLLTWAGWIMAFYVGKRGIENVVRIIKR